MSGEIDAYVDVVPTAIAAVDEGLARTLAVLGPQR